MPIFALVQQRRKRKMVTVPRYLLRYSSYSNFSFVSVNASQVSEGICNRGEGTYPCLLTENPDACPADTHAVLYRAATCAPCVEDSSDCPCVPDLYECQQC